MKKIALFLALVLTCVFVLPAFAAEAPVSQVAVIDEDGKALFEAGKAYYEAGVYDEALPIFEEMDQKGNVQASYMLGMMYLQGYGVETDLVRAKELLLKAAEGGDVQGMFRMGYELKHGTFGESDPESAANWYQKASALGYGSASNNLAFLYVDGVGVSKNPAEAVRLLELAVEQGATDSAVRLARLYASDRLGAPDYAKAAQWYEKAIELKNEDALNELADLYFDGKLTGAPDYLKAIEYYELSAAENNSSSMTQLGNIYFQGYGVEKDILKAEQYFIKASWYGNSNATLYLAMRYEEGDFNGVPDYAKAVDWYEKSAFEGNLTAAEKLARLYLSGANAQDGTVLVAPDYHQALIMLDRAWTLGTQDEWLISWLGYFYCGHSDIRPADYSKAVEFYNKAVEMGDSYSMEMLGDLYRDGHVGAADPEKAAEYYAMAVAAGRTEAQAKLDALKTE